MYSSKYFIVGSISMLFLAMILEPASSKCSFNVKIKQTIIHDGFYRNITYRVMSKALGKGNKELNKHCFLGFDQPLAPNMYAHPDELGVLRKPKQIIAFSKNKVNVELPAEQASSSSVYLIGKLTQEELELWVPVHARYHHATAGGGMARFEIPYPKLYIKCPDDRLKACQVPNKSEVSFFCNSSSNEKCEWIQIPYTILTKKLVWEVPVGNMDHYYVTAIGTALVIIIGSLYILKIIHDYKMKELKKTH